LELAAGLSDNPAIITALVEVGTDPNQRSEGAYGRTPLKLSARSNTNTDALVALIKAGADPNARAGFLGLGETPLHKATTFNADPAIIATLIKAGADPTNRDWSRWIPVVGSQLVALTILGVVVAVKRRRSSARPTPSAQEPVQPV
jgi:ankyrin repeat protein